MRRTLGKLTAAAVTCLALGVTGGCGSSSSTATDSSPDSEPAGSPSRTPGAIDGAHVLPLISITGAGGEVQATAAPLDTEADIAAFARQFHVPVIRHRVRAAIARELTVPGHEIYGQVIAVGCDRPPGADVMVTQDGEMVPHEVASPLEECLVAVTTIAIAVLPTT
jgi:hypothetical protein